MEEVRKSRRGLTRHKVKVGMQEGSLSVDAGVKLTCSWQEAREKVYMEEGRKTGDSEDHQVDSRALSRPAWGENQVSSGSCLVLRFCL